MRGSWCNADGIAMETGGVREGARERDTMKEGESGRRGERERGGGRVNKRLHVQGKGMHRGRRGEE